MLFARVELLPGASLGLSSVSSMADVTQRFDPEARFQKRKG
jgi:hypothetical protein